MPEWNGAHYGKEDATRTSSGPNPLPASPGGCLVLVSSTTPLPVGQVFRFGDQYRLIGRSSEYDIRVDDHGVSRHHARIIPLPGGAGYELCDLDSKNGTYLNGARISRARLAEGDQIQIGSVSLLRFSM